MRPLTARLAGAGTAVVLALGVAAGTVQQRAEAASPVCFTVWGGDCYCVDFFFTKVKEQVISQGQQYINNLMGEYNGLMQTGVQETLGQQVGNPTTYRGYLDEEHRAAFGLPSHERALPASSSVPPGTRAAIERDTQGQTLMGRQARAIATATAQPERLAPYQATRDPGLSVAPAEVQDWIDRMVLEPGSLSIPDDQGIAQMSMGDLLALYDQARHYLGANYSRHHMLELASSEQRVQALEASRRRLDVESMDQPGANQAAAMVAQTVTMGIDAELLESQLRRESLSAALLAMRVGSAYDGR